MRERALIARRRVRCCGCVCARVRACALAWARESGENSGAFGSAPCACACCVMRVRAHWHVRAHGPTEIIRRFMPAWRSQDRLCRRSLL
jgi:hypothetical protein